MRHIRQTRFIASNFQEANNKKYNNIVPPTACEHSEHCAHKINDSTRKPISFQ